MATEKIQSNGFRWGYSLGISFFWIASLLVSQVLLSNFDHVRSKFLLYTTFSLNKNVINDLDELPNPGIHIYSHDPLVIYVTSFVTSAEAAMLMHLVKDSFKPSMVGPDLINTTMRLSQSAYPPRSHPVVKRIEERALSFQGYDSRNRLEPIQIVQYPIDGHYNAHTDWFPDEEPVRELITRHRGGNRESSFFVYLHANSTGGGTEFPKLSRPAEKFWCDYIECAEEDNPEGSNNVTARTGVTFKPIAGNAIFWRNLHPDGQGHWGTRHAGQPVKSGSKTGLNIWTRQMDIARYKPPTAKSES